MKDLKSSCIIWPNAIDKSGYGRVWFRKKNFLAHRMVFILNFGEIPDDFHVCHKCDERRCINPDHFFLGKNIDNVKDKVSKNRQAKGVKNGRAKLTLDQVQIIKELYKDGLTQNQIANYFKVSQWTISAILNKKKWNYE